jgi:hypothetical protein
MAIIDLLNTQQGITDDLSAVGTPVKTARLTPINAVAASVTILATEVAQMTNGDTITFDDVVLTKASSTSAADGEFADVAGIRACIDELLTDWVSSGTTNATATRATKGIAWNAMPAVSSIIEATTAGGGESAKSEATIAAAMLAVLAAGDSVTFAGSTFTKVASGPTAIQFTNTAGLAALLNAVAGWDAAVDTADIDITAAENGAANDGEDVVITLNRATSGGVNGTAGLKDQIVADATYLYACTADNTVNGANWRPVSLGSVD